MIILEILVWIFVEIIFEGIILGSFRILRKGFNQIRGMNSEIKHAHDTAVLNGKQLLYQEIVLTKNLNTKFQTGQKGIVLEIIDKNKVFAAFYDENGHQIEWNNELVFEVDKNNFKLKNQE